jgi:hypothetical protein
MTRQMPACRRHSVRVSFSASDCTHGPRVLVSACCCVAYFSAASIFALTLPSRVFFWRRALWIVGCLSFASVSSVYSVCQYSGHTTRVCSSLSLVNASLFIVHPDVDMFEVLAEFADIV